MRQFSTEGEPNGGAGPVCTVHSMQVVGPATACARCLFFCVQIFLTGALTYDTRTGHKDKNYEDETRHPMVPMVEGVAEGGGGGDLANGPLDGQTNRGSNPRRR